jgi:hypothetical protein
MISAGSCFAQHVGSWLVHNGYTWLPSPLVPDGTAFSFALGNIYTPAALVQWLRAALGETSLAGTTHVENGRHLDLLRPAVFPAGFEDAAALEDARRAALSEMLTRIE